MSAPAENALSPVAVMMNTSNILVVHPSVQTKSVQELIALAKAKPGALNYASGSTGSASHLAAELFKFRARVDITRINYKSAILGIVVPATTSAAADSAVAAEGWAKDVLAGLQQGRIDRSKFTANCNFYFDAEALADRFDDVGAR